MSRLVVTPVEAKTRHLDEVRETPFIAAGSVMAV
jgi:hypothetical protein